MKAKLESVSILLAGISFSVLPFVSVIIDVSFETWKAMLFVQLACVVYFGWKTAPFILAPFLRK